jgi:hypothetical protein
MNWRRKIRSSFQARVLKFLIFAVVINSSSGIPIARARSQRQSNVKPANKAGKKINQHQAKVNSSMNGTTTIVIEKVEDLFQIYPLYLRLLANPAPTLMVQLPEGPLLLPGGLPLEISLTPPAFDDTSVNVEFFGPSMTKPARLQGISFNVRAKSLSFKNVVLSGGKTTVVRGTIDEAFTMSNSIVRGVQLTDPSRREAILVNVAPNKAADILLDDVLMTGLGGAALDSILAVLPSSNASAQLRLRNSWFDDRPASLATFRVEGTSSVSLEGTVVNSPGLSSQAVLQSTGTKLVANGSIIWSGQRIVNSSGPVDAGAVKLPKTVEAVFTEKGQRERVAIETPQQFGLYRNRLLAEVDR